MQPFKQCRAKYSKRDHCSKGVSQRFSSHVDWKLGMSTKLARQKEMMEAYNPEWHEAQIFSVPHLLLVVDFRMLNLRTDPCLLVPDPARPAIRLTMRLAIVVYWRKWIELVSLSRRITQVSNIRSKTVYRLWKSFRAIGIWEEGPNLGKISFI